MGIQITPSILTADFADLGAELARIPSADWVHVDVMDNHFVPNLTFGPRMVEALAASTTQPIDAHLMITDADRNAAAYVEAGAASVTFHVEAAAAPVRPWLQPVLKYEYFDRPATVITESPDEASNQAICSRNARSAHCAKPA